MKREYKIFKRYRQKYQSLGFIPYPALKKGKSPIHKWRKELPIPCTDDYEEWEEKYPGANIWLLIGPEHVVIDPDGLGAEEFVRSLNLPKCPTSISGKRSIHRWFKVTKPVPPIKITKDGTDETWLEIRTGHMGMLAPPSIHPETGKPYRWLEGHSPWEISFPELPEEALQKIRALIPESPKPESPKLERPISDNSLGTLDVARYLDHHGIKYTIKSWKGATIYALDKCLFAEHHTTTDQPGDSGIIQGSDGKLAYQCFHNHCAMRTWHDARQAISGDASIAEFCEGYKRPSQKNRDKDERHLVALESCLIEAESFVAVEIPAKKAILGSWLTEQSISLISGWRGTGKTWFALSASDCITKGEPFGPWKVETPVTIAYVDGEMPAADMQERINDLNLTNPGQRQAPLYVFSDAYANLQGLQKANLLNPKWRDAMYRVCLNKGIKLLVLDNISSLCPGIDENSKWEWDPVNQWLLSLRFSGIATIFLHHTNKEGNQRGTSGREDNLDNSIILQRPHDYSAEEGARFVLRFLKARVRTQELSSIADTEFKLTEMDGKLVWTWSDVKKQTKGEVLKLLSQGHKQVDIAELLGITKGAVSKIKQRLVKEEFISKMGSLTVKGSEYLVQDGNF